jgi:endoglucanase
MPDPIRFTSDAERTARERRRREQQRRLVRRRRLTGLAGVAAVVVVVIAAVALLGSSGNGTNPATANTSGPGSTAPTSTGPTTPSKYLTCKDPSNQGALHVSGNKLLDAAGKEFVPYGVTTTGGIDYIGDNAWKTYQPQVLAQIKAAHTYWHANTIRLPVGEGNIFNKGVVGDGVNTAVLKVLCQQVQLVRRLGMQAVIVDQTEWPDWSERLATPRSVAFWKVITGIFNNQPGVSYDLFNEPHLFNASTSATAPSMSQNWIWRMWRNGGKAGGQDYVGMQQLFNDVRRTGATNVTWIEGPYFDNTLQLAGKYPVHGTNMVWSIHHPGLISSADWNLNFGYLTSKYPVVDGEWGQYSASRPECRSTAYTMVPQYLAYLHAHNIGVLGWTLEPGAMLADPDHTLPANFSVPGQTSNPADLATPNQMSSSYACTNADVGQGAGQLLMNEFKEFSHPAS